MSISLSHISILTNNLVKLSKFYVNFFNFKIKFRFKNNNKIYGYFIEINKNCLIEIFNTNKKLNRYGQLSHFCFLVNSNTFTKLLIKAKKKKILVKDSYKISKKDKVEQFKIVDPDSNICEIHKLSINSPIYKNEL